MALKATETIKRPLVPIGMPKAEMHIHISLALSNEVFLRRIQEMRTPIKPEFLLERDHRYYPDLKDHHRMYEAMRHITSTPDELAQVTQMYLERIAREGAIYAEISNSFRNPALFESQMDAISEAIECARHNTGIEARIVVTTLRDMGHQQAEMAARYLAEHPRKLVTCFGLVGDESLDRLSDYKTAMAIAFNEAGLGLAPHVAEQYLHNAVDFLDALPKEALNRAANDDRRVRAGHATLTHTSQRLMDKFAEHAICIESCLSANKRINVPHETRALKMGDTITGASGEVITLDRPLTLYFNDLGNHPLTRFVQAGIPVCLGSDNPLLQNTNIGKEYSLAVKAGLTDMHDVLTLTENAIRFANVDAATRATLMARVDTYRNHMRAGTVPDTTALGYRRAYTHA